MQNFARVIDGVQLTGAHFPVDPSTIEITSITSDSRAVKPGALFVAVRGGSQDGHHFIETAIRAGAVAFVCEELPVDEAARNLPYIKVRDARLALARLAANFHDHPSQSMVMVGVTGTSGKTTTTYLIESILQKNGRRVGVIGTVNFRYRGKVLDSTHTTPGAVELQALLAEMKAQGCDAVVMEVSSHALKQHRAAHVAFDAMVFSNLSPEHLDFHTDMEDYYASKRILFQELVDVSLAAGKNPTAVVNADEPYGQRLIGELQSSHRKDGLNIIRYGMNEKDLEVSGAGFRIDLAGVRGELDGEKLESPLTGKFNASNILAAIGASVAIGLTPKEAALGVTALKGVPGRLERVSNSKGVHVLVDYAHKPDALEKVLKTLQEVRSTGRLITVFGCGGDRDRKKRPLMGRIAVQLSNHVFVTSDNPRTEDPNGIIAEILEGTQGHSNLTVEPDRKKAITAAVQMARPGDLVLIAGKGHEDYQIILDPSSPTRTRKIHFDDREIAAEALKTFS